MSHSPTPWRVEIVVGSDGDGVLSPVDATGEPIASIVNAVYESTAPEFSTADTKRIVAAVNATANVPLSVLQDMSGDKKYLCTFNNLEELQEQVKIFREALKREKLDSHAERL